MKRETIAKITLIPLGIAMFACLCFAEYKKENARRHDSPASASVVNVSSTEDDWNKGYDLGYKLGVVSARSGDPVPTEAGLQAMAKDISTHSNDIIDKAKFDRAFYAGFEAGYKKVTKRAF